MNVNFKINGKTLHTMDVKSTTPVQEVKDFFNQCFDKGTDISNEVLADAIKNTAKECNQAFKGNACHKVATLTKSVDVLRVLLSGITYGKITVGAPSEGERIEIKHVTYLDVKREKAADMTAHDVFLTYDDVRKYVAWFNKTVDEDSKKLHDTCPFNADMIRYARILRARMLERPDYVKVTIAGLEERNACPDCFKKSSKNQKKMQLDYIFKLMADELGIEPFKGISAMVHGADAFLNRYICKTKDFSLEQNHLSIDTFISGLVLHARNAILKKELRTVNEDAKNDFENFPKQGKTVKQ